jgi:kynurenine formamidase
VWGEADELGNLNELSPALASKALRLAATGAAYDLGLTYDRRTYKFAGHAAGEIATYRTPQGLLKPGGVSTGPDNSSLTSYASCLNSISDNVATQIDGLAHIFVGADPSAYNGYKASDVVGDYGLLKCGVETIPPIVAPGTLLDVARHVGRDPLPEGYAIEPDLVQGVLAAQGVEIDPLDVVLLRTGTGGVYLRGDGVGANHDELRVHDRAGITVATARYLVEERGALMIASDTTGLEVLPAREEVPGGGTSFNPVHVYLLVQQGVHIGEFHNLEALARDRVYKFAYVLAPNKIKGNVAGTVQRPVALA